MSPLAAWIASESVPLVLAAALVCEWWALWFTLGRNFSATTQLVLAANGASLLLAWIARGSGALGPTGAAASGPWYAWAGAWLLLWAANFLVEAVVLRVWLRRRQRSWRWNPYDLAVLAGVNAATLGLAAIHRLFG